MLKTGDFSKLSGVSVRMLCRYAEIGLLKPAETDRFTDYRYYREDHLPTVCCITALKNMGFSLADIVRILDIYVDKKKLDRCFAERLICAAKSALRIPLRLRSRMRLLTTKSPYPCRRKPNTEPGRRRSGRGGGGAVAFAKKRKIRTIFCARQPPWLVF